MNLQVLLRGLLFLLSLVLIGYLLEHTPVGEMLTEKWFDSQIRGKGVAGEVMFVSLGAVLTAVGLPRQAIAFLGGYAFGFVAGSLLAVLGAVSGCVLSFYYARWLGRHLVLKLFPGRIRRIDDFLEENTFSMTLLVRLLPVGSNLVTNLAAGVSNVRSSHFFAGSAVGYLPQTIVFSLVGSGIQFDPMLRIGLGIILFLVSGVLGVFLYRRYRHGKTLDASLDADAG